METDEITSSVQNNILKSKLDNLKQVYDDSDSLIGKTYKKKNMGRKIKESSNDSKSTLDDLFEQRNMIDEAENFDILPKIETGRDVQSFQNDDDSTITTDSFIKKIKKIKQSRNKPDFIVDTNNLSMKDHHSSTTTTTLMNQSSSSAKSIPQDIKKSKVKSKFNIPTTQNKISTYSPDSFDYAVPPYPQPKNHNNNNNTIHTKETYHHHPPPTIKSKTHTKSKIHSNTTNSNSNSNIDDINSYQSIPIQPIGQNNSNDYQDISFSTLNDHTEILDEEDFLMNHLNHLNEDMGLDGLDPVMLHKKIHVLEHSLDQLQAECDTKDTLLKQKDNDLLLLRTTYEKSINQYKEKLNQQEEQYKIAIMKIHEQHTQELAMVNLRSMQTMTSATLKATNSPNKNNNNITIFNTVSDTNNGDTTANKKIDTRNMSLSKINTTTTNNIPGGSREDVIELNNELTRQIELLRTNETLLQLQMIEEKKSLQLEYTKKVTNIENDLNKEIMTLRHQIDEYEDKLLNKEELISLLQSKLLTASKLNQQLESNKEEVSKSLLQANTHITQLKQFINTNIPPHLLMNLDHLSTCLSADSTHGGPTTHSSTTNNPRPPPPSGPPQRSNGGGPPLHHVGIGPPPIDNLTRINEAKEESKFKQLNNKIDFLKSQLETEQNTIEDLKQALSISQAKIQEIKYESRTKMTEFEQQKKQTLEELELRMENALDDKIDEYNALQSKYNMLEQQLNEVKQDLLTSKQKEETHKAAINKLQVQQSSLKNEYEQLNNLYIELKHDHEKNVNTQDMTYQNDAIIKRLENERQYLKSQVSAEITLKNELQKALIQSQQQIHETNRKWHIEIDTLKNTQIILQQQLVTNEQNYNNKMIEYDNEKTHLLTQNNEYKETYQKHREALRNQEMKLEENHRKLKNLEEFLELQKAEIKEIYQVHEKEKTQWTQKIEDMNILHLEKERELTEDIVTLKHDLSQQYITMTSLQQEICRLQDTAVLERQESNKQLACIKLYHILSQYRLKQLATVYREWYLFIVTQKMNVTFHTELSQYEQKWLHQSSLSQDETINNIKKTLKENHQQELIALQSKYDNILFDMKSDYIHEKNVIEQSLTTQYQSEIDELKKAHMLEIESIDKKYNQEIDDIKMKHCQVIQEYENNLKQKEEQHNDQIKEMKNTLEIQMNQHWEEKIKLLENEYKQKADNNLSKLENESLEKFEILLTQAKQKWKKKIETKEAEFKAEIEGLSQKYEQEKLSICAQYEVKLKDQENEHNRMISAIQEEHETNITNEIQKIKIQYQEELKQEVSDVEIDMKIQQDKAMETLRKEYEVKEVQVIKATKEEVTSELRSQYEQNLQQEIQKWKNIIIEMETSYQQTLTSLKHEYEIEKETTVSHQIMSIEMKEKENTDKLLMETKLQLEKLTSFYETQLNLQKQVFDKERIMIEKETEIKVMDEINRLRDEKMVMELHEVRIKMEDERQEKLNKANDLYNKLQLETTSKQALMQDDINHLKGKIKKLETMNKENEQHKQILKLDYENHKVEILKQHTIEMENLTKKYELQNQETLMKVETVHQSLLEESINKIKESLSAENEQQIVQIQEQSELVISGLETSLLQIRQEKDNLETQIRQLNEQIENTQDSIYDMQLTQKTQLKEFSIKYWQLLTCAQKLKISHKKQIDQVTKQWNSDKNQLIRDNKKGLHDKEILLQQVCQIYQNIESHHTEIYSTLMSYKSDVVHNTNKEIQVIHTEIDQLSSELSYTEDLKVKCEEDIELLNHQIRGIEDQIREHNRESMIQNGRLNVLHGKKKKRLDEDLETIMNSLEQKHNENKEIEQKIEYIIKKRNEKELKLTEYEKYIVDILFEQQKLIGNILSDIRTNEKEMKTTVISNGYTWPISVDGGSGISSSSMPMNVLGGNNMLLKNDDEDEDDLE